MTLAIKPPNEVAIGNDAAWALVFHDDLGPTRPPGGALLEVSSAEYGGEIRATLPGGLEPGSYDFVIEGLDDAGHRKLAAAASLEPRPVVRLYLFWREANATVGGYLANVAGLGAFGVEAPDNALVAVLSVESITRQLGRTRYETHVKACERAWRRLCELPFAQPVTGTTYGAAATELGGKAETRVVVHGAPVTPSPDAAPDELPSELGQPSSDDAGDRERARGADRQVRTRAAADPQRSRPCRPAPDPAVRRDAAARPRVGPDRGPGWRVDRRGTVRRGSARPAAAAAVQAGAEGTPGPEAGRRGQL